MHNKKYFCYEIYKNLGIWSSNGELTYNPCSFYNGHIKTDDKLDVGTVWNSPEHLNLKSCVETDMAIPGCATCYKQERQGLTSRRESAKILYEDFHKDTTLDLTGPQGIDYSVGNLCNLKCIICGPANSSQWIPDYKKLNPGANIDRFKYKKFEQIEINDASSLANVKNIHFHGGGEPLLSDNHLNLLKKIRDVAGLGNVRVFYNTNGTQTVSDEVLKIWEECKLIELYFSIDDIGQRFEYQRTGASWKAVEDNLKWFTNNMPHNHMFKINCCWGYLNLYYLNELYDWYENNFKTNRYGDETNLIFQQVIGKYNINTLSQSAIDLLTKKFNGYDALLSLVNTIPSSSVPHTAFWNNISALDTIRNTDFKTVCPEWSEILS